LDGKYAMTLRPLSLTHLVQEPAQPSVGKPPLLLLLHGVGSNEQDLFALASYADPRFFVISARAPVVLGPGAYGWYPVQWTEGGPHHDPAEAQAGREAAAAFIKEAVDAYGLDADQVYLAGFSQGAITSLSIALLSPQSIAGAVIMSGRLLPEVLPLVAAPDKLRGLPLLVVHGTRDAVLPIADGREINQALSPLPVDLTYKEYDMAHQVSAESLGDVSAWLSHQLDSASPPRRRAKTML